VATGIIVAPYQYDAWGNALVEPDDDTNPYRWCGLWGYYWDGNTKKYLLGLRWYDPTLGRFITQDPIGFAAGSLNLYSYAGNNSTNSKDPSGMLDCNMDDGRVIALPRRYRITRVKGVLTIMPPSPQMDNFQ